MPCIIVLLFTAVDKEALTPTSDNAGDVTERTILLSEETLEKSVKWHLVSIES